MQASSGVFGSHGRALSSEQQLQLPPQPRSRCKPLQGCLQLSRPCLVDLSYSTPPTCGQAKASVEP